MIVECRAVGNSFGFEQGDPRSVEFRARKLHAALSDIDEKARWLAVNPVGKNYDIRQFDFVMPVAVTPFAEFIPGLQGEYWITDDLPRVLTPRELRSALQDGVLKMAPLNSVPVLR